MSTEGIVIINNQPGPLECFKNFQTLCCNVEDIVVRDELNFNSLVEKRPIYFVSPANSLLYMDGGVDYAYMRMFPNIQQKVQMKMRTSDKPPISFLGRKYLPVGASMKYKIDENYYLISAPTMLLPQVVKKSNNAYYAMKAILKVWSGDGTLVVPMLAAGVGQIPPEEVYKQIKRAVDEGIVCCNDDFYIPNKEELEKIFDEQPKIYENSEFVEGIIEGLVKPVEDDEEENDE